MRPSPEPGPCQFLVEPSRRAAGSWSIWGLAVDRSKQRRAAPSSAQGAPSNPAQRGSSRQQIHDVHPQCQTTWNPDADAAEARPAVVPQCFPQCPSKALWRLQGFMRRISATCREGCKPARPQARLEMGDWEIITGQWQFWREKRREKKKKQGAVSTPYLTLPTSPAHGNTIV